MALQRLKIACCVCLVYVCFALLAGAAEFSPLTGEEYGQKFEPQAWGPGIDNPAPQTLRETENDFYKEAAIAKDNEEKRGTKNDRLRGLRRLSRLHSELGYVKKTPETADGMYSLDEKRSLLNHQIEGNQFEAQPALDFPKRDAGPHAWYGTGMFGKRQDETRGRWRIRSPKPFRVGLFGKRDYETADRDELARFIESLYW